MVTMGALREKGIKLRGTDMNENRYQNMHYRRCGNSGVLLPEISLGLWHNFGNITPFEVQRSILTTAFDHGICHFDLANNYGPPYGEAERNFGKHMDADFHVFRDELFISTKAGYDMWPGPYGDHGSRKYLVSSLDQSLKRMHLEYVDLFYHHRPDPDTPIEETAAALDYIVRSGKALYVGISNYGPEAAAKMLAELKRLGTPCLIEQSRYNMLERTVENGLLDVIEKEQVGFIAFSPLAKGLLTGKYLNGIPADSRAAVDPRFLKKEDITQEITDKINKLNDVAKNRGQKLSQMALSWILKDERVTSVLIGASKPEQVLENIKAIDNTCFSQEETVIINTV